MALRQDKFSGISVSVAGTPGVLSEFSTGRHKILVRNIDCINNEEALRIYHLAPQPGSRSNRFSNHRHDGR